MSKTVRGFLSSHIPGCESSLFAIFADFFAIVTLKEVSMPSCVLFACVVCGNGCGASGSRRSTNTRSRGDYAAMAAHAI